MGVPQVSILTPFLFTLYTNELPEVLPEVFMPLFADNSTQFFNSKIQAQLLVLINMDHAVEIFSEWPS